MEFLVSHSEMYIGAIPDNLSLAQIKILFVFSIYDELSSKKEIMQPIEVLDSFL